MEISVVKRPFSLPGRNTAHLRCHLRGVPPPSLEPGESNTDLKASVSGDGNFLFLPDSVKSSESSVLVLKGPRDPGNQQAASGGEHTNPERWASREAPRPPRGRALAALGWGFRVSRFKVRAQLQTRGGVSEQTLASHGRGLSGKRIPRTTAGPQPQAPGAAWS